MPVFIDPERGAQAVCGLVVCPGEPVHLGLGHQCLGQQRCVGGFRDQCHHLVRQLASGGELAAAGRQLGPGCPPPGQAVVIVGWGG